MKTKSKEISGDVPSVSELLSIINSLQKEMIEQRSELASQRRELQQLRQTTKGSSLGSTALPDKKTTTRRRMLRQLASGAAGIAALGVVASATAPASEAATNTFDYNGTSGGVGINTSAAVTQISAAGATAYPIFKFSNTSSAGSGTDPNALPIGVLSQSTNSFAIYGSTTGSSTAPTAIIGVSGNNGVLTNAFFSNSVGGVAGTSNFNPGTVGLSQTNSGLEGRSFSGYGAKGISSSGVGGAFANAGGDNVTGAALRLGLRGTPPPTGATAPSHLAGEFFVDQAARVWVCMAGYQPVGGLAPQAAGTDPGFPTGPLSATAGPTWRILAPMTIRTQAPDSPFTLDNDLHVRGEQWWDSSTGILYICTTTGSKDNTVLATLGIAPGTLPVFLPTRGAGATVKNFTFSDRFVNTSPGPNNRGGIVGPVAAQSNSVFTLRGASGRDGQVIPTNATGIIGIISVISPTGNGLVKILSAGTPTTTGTASLSFTAGANAGGVYIASFNAAGQVEVYNNSPGTINILVDVAGYFV